MILASGTKGVAGYTSRAKAATFEVVKSEWTQIPLDTHR